MDISQENSFKIKKYLLTGFISLIVVLIAFGFTNASNFKTLFSQHQQQEVTDSNVAPTQDVEEEGISAVLPADYEKQSGDSSSNFYENADGNLVAFYKTMATPSMGTNIVDFLPELKEQNFDKSALDAASFLHEQGFTMKLANLEGDDESKTIVAMKKDSGKDPFEGIRQHSRPIDPTTIYLISHEGKVFGFDGNIDEAVKVFSQFSFNE